MQDLSLWLEHKLSDDQIEYVNQHQHHNLLIQMMDVSLTRLILILSMSVRVLHNEPILH